jgi:hypothetical protein
MFIHFDFDDIVIFLIFTKVKNNLLATPQEVQYVGKKDFSDKIIHQRMFTLQ